MRRHFASLGSLVCALAIASCGGGDDDGGGGGPASIQVTPEAISVAQQQTAQLQVSLLDSEGLLVTGVSVSFTSEDTDVATVSNTGLVSGARAGTTSVRVRGGGLTANVPVTVTAVSNAIVVTPNPGVLPQTSTLQLNAVVNDLNGEPVPGAPLLFSSGNQGIATVSATGLVTPVGPSGQVVITVQSGTLSATVPVAITQVPTSLDVRPSPVNMGKSGTTQLTVIVRDAVDAPVPGINTTYTSSTPALATVSASGLVQGKGLIGSLSIHIAAAGMTKDIPVTLVDLGSPVGVLDGTSALGTPTYGVDVSPAGLIMVTGWRTSRATLTDRTFTELPISSSFQFAPAIALNGTTAWVSGVPNWGISEVNVNTGAVLGSVTGLPGGDIYMLRLSPDGQYLYGSTVSHLFVINTATRALERDISTRSIGLSLALNPVGTSVFVGGDGEIQEINPATGDARTVTTLANKNFAISPDGQFLYLVTEYEATIKVVRVSDGTLATTIPVSCAGWGVSISREGQQLFVTCNSSLLMVRTDTQQMVTLPLAGTLRRTAFSADGLTAVVTSENGNVYFIK